MGLFDSFCALLARQIGDRSARDPVAAFHSLSPDARALVDAAFEDIDRTRLVDYHSHIIGLGHGGTGCCVQASYFHSWNPLRRIKMHTYMSAGGVTVMEAADAQFVERLATLARAFPQHGRHCLLAFDAHHSSETGLPDAAHTDFYTPNDYVRTVAARHPDVFLPTCSVHPYRADALEELDRCAAAGIGMVKWLPNAMNIDPSSPRCDAFYARCRELSLVILSHAGEEKAVDADEHQRLGNPLLMRRALDAGVTVILAHCASLGCNPDLDDPKRPMVDNLVLFFRMMDTPAYQDRLFADISAITLWTRCRCVIPLLRRPDLHSRLVNGSDYPLPNISVLIQTHPLVDLGLITDLERHLLNEIYGANPLLYDFVLKRTLRGPRGERFPASVFMINEALCLQFPPPPFDAAPSPLSAMAETLAGGSVRSLRPLHPRPPPPLLLAIWRWFLLGLASFKSKAIAQLSILLLATVVPLACYFLFDVLL